MADSTAWLLELDSQMYAAVGELEIIHLLQSPPLHVIPKAPFYCNSVLVWQDRIIPLFDLLAWLEGYPLPRAHDTVAICAYQPQPGASLHYGALSLATIPVRVRLSDEQACTLPTQAGGWRELAIACVEDAGRTIPIIDLPYIFSGALHLPSSAPAARQSAPAPELKTAR